ncbi:hypothetical protein [Deinococcus koreensis]|uniref:Uncharacterized protein n=1 Tax=Deinococcus koreensis TaxID=2054903 RepID=A0A2K3UU79_9DEIO|nr:hypothetical protein [Deinococcus koreensis]PNY80093.1 hypothetical protein CVO96_00855 [Deinococcus koreensis]
MNVIRHFSDTRTEQGRVRFLLQSGRVHLTAEGQGWAHSSRHTSLEEAATFLATVAQVPGGLYRQALDDLERQLQLEQEFHGAA